MDDIYVIVDKNQEYVTEVHTLGEAILICEQNEGYTYSKNPDINEEFDETLKNH